MDLKNALLVVQMDSKEIEKFVSENYADLKLDAFISRFENVLIGTNEVAHMHSVNPRTVLNYIKDGLIDPEIKLGENDHPVFRLSYALTLDFKELRKQLRAKNKGY